MNPLFEEMEVEGMGIGDLSYLQPLNKEREIITYLLSVENTVDHVTTE